MAVYESHYDMIFIGLLFQVAKKHVVSYFHVEANFLPAIHSYCRPIRVQKDCLWTDKQKTDAYVFWPGSGSCCTAEAFWMCLLVKLCLNLIHYRAYVLWHTDVGFPLFYEAGSLHQIWKQRRRDLMLLVLNSLLLVLEVLTKPACLENGYLSSSLCLIFLFS